MTSELPLPEEVIKTIEDRKNEKLTAMDACLSPKKTNVRHIKGIIKRVYDFFI